MHVWLVSCVYGMSRCFLIHLYECNYEWPWKKPIFRISFSFSPILPKTHNLESFFNSQLAYVLQRTYEKKNNPISPCNAIITYFLLVVNYWWIVEFFFFFVSQKPASKQNLKKKCSLKIWGFLEKYVLQICVWIFVPTTGVTSIFSIFFVPFDIRWLIFDNFVNHHNQQFGTSKGPYQLLKQSWANLGYFVQCDTQRNMRSLFVNFILLVSPRKNNVILLETSWRIEIE